MEKVVNSSLAHIANFRKRNIWYSIRDGNWEDPSIWMGNAVGRRGAAFPNSSGDDVVISHQVTIINTNASYNIKHLLINNFGTLKSQAINASITINGNLQCAGALDFSSNANTNVVLNGYDNFINNLIPGTASTVTYNGQYSQFIIDLPYRNLTTSNTGLRYLKSNLTILGNLNLYNLECGDYDLTVNGYTNINHTTPNAGGYFTKSGPGNLLFIGALQRAANVSNIDWSVGNPNVEFRGGINFNSAYFNTGTGNFIFTTNNQTIDMRFVTGTWIAPIIISGAITVTNNVALSILNTYATINGNNIASKFVNNGQLYFYSSSSTSLMTTGVFLNNPTSVVGYMFNGDFTIPNFSYSSVTTAGTGAKSLGANTSITGTLLFGGDFDCGAYDLVVGGNLYSNSSLATFSKTNAGNIVVMGSFGGSGGILFNANFSDGNPNIEFKGGINLNNYLFKSGVGNFTFTTNNQNLILANGSAGTSLIAPIVISDGITVTNTGTSNPIWLGAISGTNAASTFDNRATFTYRNSQQPMQTGLLQTNAAANTFIYGLAGAQDITPVTYRNLTLNNNGVKKLLGNISVQNTYTLTAPATLNNNGFTLTNP